MRRAFATLNDGRHQVHYRCEGSGTPVVLLPAAPDSSAAVALTWPGRRAIAIDLPGCGDSDPLAMTAPSVDDYAQALSETFDALGLEEPSEVVGWGAGAKIAARFAEQFAERVTSLTQHEPVELECPALEPEWDGTHLVRAWMIRRDMHLFSPWFARTPVARLRADLPPPEQLQGEFLDFLKATSPMGRPPAFTRDYVDASFGQVHVWRSRPRGGTPLLMLHASPGSSRGVLPLASGLQRSIIAMDTPGFGDSDPLTNEDPSIGDFADAVLEVIDDIGEPEVDLYGTHTGASIALEAATRSATRIRRVVFDGLPMFSTGEGADHLANYVPPFEIRWDGSHVMWAWNFIRNMSLFYPWYHMDAQHSTGRAPDTAMLHQRVVDLMKAGPHYAKGYRAVYRYDPRPALAQLAVPSMLCVSREDVLAPHAKRAGQARPDVRTEWLPSEGRVEATAAAIEAFLG